MQFLAILIFLLAIDFLGISTLPLLFLLLFCIMFLERKMWIFALAFLSGLLLDLLLMRPMGLTSLFFVVFLFLVLLYGRKFEIQNPVFILLAGFLGSVSYLFIFGYQHIFAPALISALGAVLIWKIIYKMSL